MTLTGPIAPARSGTARSLVVLLHGYGADGADLFGLAPVLAEALPDTAFRAPNAPERCRMNPMGYQWFPIPWLDGASEAEMQAGFDRAATVLAGWLKATMAEIGVGPEATALLGFSQGTMMSLEVGPRLGGLAGIVGFSGRLARGESLGQAVAKPPVLLIHGDGDEMIPVAAMGEAAEALTAAGFDVRTHISAGMGHGIAPDGLGLARRFLADRLRHADAGGA